ncbi:hypothetical protein DFR52_103433 [Hoeflea marina]|uniref:Dolichyl-phosphate-mannose-protein mannosyltransferase n=2 Tax=Hoeflea marina TaxID=274592 RepID=A0A317PP09_9HYPH|nr:hypothetical protein DFR52_103433 [Hoeflea marina]
MSAARNGDRARPPAAAFTPTAMDVDMKLFSRIDAEAALVLALLVLMAAAVFQLAMKSAFDIGSDWIPVYGSALAGGLVLALMALRFPRALPGLLLASVAVPLMLLGHTPALMIVVFQWCTVFALGLLFAPGRVESNDQVAGALIIGYVVYSVALLCLVHLGVFTPWVIATFHLIPIAAAGWFCRGKLRPGSILSRRAQDATSALTDLAILFLVFAGAIILVYFATVPDNGSDSIAAYRPMITDILRDGALTIDPTKRTINLLPLIELWGQTASATLAQDLHAAKIWNLSIFLFAFYVLASAGSRLGARLPHTAILLGTAVCILVPAFYNVTLSGFVDNSALLMTAVMVFWCLRIVSSETETDGFTYRNAIWAGLILGLAFISKYTLVFSIAFLAIALTAYIAASKRFQEKYSKIAITAVSALILPVSYLLFVYYVTGNPFFPFENEKWQSPFFGTHVFVSVHSGYLHPALFWDMTVNTGAYSVSGAVDGKLGLSYLFGAVVAFYAVARALLRRDVAAGIWLTAATFLIATVLLSWAQNSSRYVAPSLALLVPAVLFVLQGNHRRLWTGFFVIMLTGHIALIPRYGYGAGTFALADSPKAAHAALYDHKLDRQRIADDLSRRYGQQGRILDLGGQAVSIGETLENGWYDHPAATRIGTALKKGAEEFAAFLADENIDAVVVGRYDSTRLDSATLALLRDSSQQVDQEGSLLVFHLRDEIRFDRFIEVPAIPGRQQYQATPEKGSFAWQIDYVCRESGTILRVNIVGGQWRDSFPAFGLCDNRQASWRSPLLAADGRNASLVVFYQFPEGLAVERAGYWYRPQ